MNPDAMALFRELADCSPAEREAYYARQRVPEAIRAEVESLLRFDGDTAGAIHGRVDAAAKVALADRAPGESDANHRHDADTRPYASESGDGRFPPGTLLADRYRIVSLVACGGMGEVYRATDLKLKQSVALKFLPQAASGDPRLLARFHGEVRLARQTTPMASSTTRSITRPLSMRTVTSWWKWTNRSTDQPFYSQSRPGTSTERVE